MVFSITKRKKERNVFRVNTPPPKGRWLLGVGRLKSMLRLKPLVTCSSRLKARGRLLAEHPRSGCPLAGTIPLTENPLAGCLRSGYPLTGTAPPRNTRPAQPDATGMGERFGTLLLRYGSQVGTPAGKLRGSSFPRFTVPPCAKAAA